MRWAAAGRQAVEAVVTAWAHQPEQQGGVIDRDHQGGRHVDVLLLFAEEVDKLLPDPPHGPLQGAVGSITRTAAHLDGQKTMRLRQACTKSGMGE